MISNRVKEEGFDLYLVQSVNNKDGSTQMSMAKPVTTAQIFSPDSLQAGYYRLAFEDKLMVQYNKDTPGKKYLQGKNVFIQGNLRMGFRSYLITAQPYILIDKDGLLPIPLSVEYSGFWMYEKMANLLPVNYEPNDIK